jgi:hypothetical protein
MLGAAEFRLVYSAVTSEKIVSVRVFIAGPAGYQNCEQAPPEPWVSHGSAMARANGTVGRWKLLEAGPARIPRENATQKTIISLRLFFPIKI